ncbi:beta-phosphoglucomutase family hydrolase [Shewanella sp. C32]|uniref:Beta-phosphoglucomutase family hydrolase n=1 Tax=Shewanella electrica TaxID=515560 RepID=A0ABT2FHG0_9GAMM|nr:beta-phosphoglucomutase family hydrolase [Shewanella electrica]MCH1923866.1 beta-phosphoglucomutase family hydrolase [Shewanella electrica]MCS4555770.1 beta-phosphoglucomutase family hydrolase [Shewanella electrica]
MIDLSQYRGIIFDMDGTLIDSMGSHQDAWRAVCEEYGYPWDEDYMYSLGGVPTLQTVVVLNEKYGMSHDPVEVAARKKLLWEEGDHTPKVIAETFAVFEHYRPSMKIGVGTGAERAHAVEMLTDTGILPRIDALVTASDVENGKPAPDTFLQVALQLGLQPAECVVFEDTQIGAKAAAAAGMDYVIVKDGKIQC